MDEVSRWIRHRILLGIDGSDSSLRALAYAVGMAKRMDALLLAVHVQPMMLHRFNDQAVVELLASSQAELAEELRKEVTRACSDADVLFVFFVERGDPMTVLRRLARSAGVDALLVGASSQALHRVLPSIGSRLVRAARWPVTVVP